MSACKWDEQTRPDQDGGRREKAKKHTNASTKATSLHTQKKRSEIKPGEGFALTKRRRETFSAVCIGDRKFTPLARLEIPQKLRLAAAQRRNEQNIFIKAREIIGMT
jgi:hypothetical protein